MPNAQPSQPAAKTTTLPAPEAPLPHEVELQKKLELLGKVRATRSKMLQNASSIEGKDPALAYAWVNINESRRNYFEALGWQLCSDPKIKTPWRREDGTHRRGDLILYQIPKDLHEAIELEASLRAIEDIETSQEGFKEFAGRSGVPVYDPGIKA